MQTKRNRQLSMDYCKAFLTVLVVLHHSILSFTFNAKAGIPIADKASFMGFDFLVGLFDNFFMFAFFFVSGYFIYNSIQKKGLSQWLAERARRLGIPFGVGILTVNAVTYFLSALIQLKQNGTVFGLNEILGILGKSIAQHGYHLWFLWLLLVFCLVLSVIVNATKRDLPIATGPFYRSSWVFLPCFVGLCLACYTPMVAVFGTAFVGFGPFDLQISRLFIYFLFFLTGYLFGKRRPEETLLFGQSRFTKAWWALLLVGLASYGLIYWFYISGAMPAGNMWLHYAFPIVSVFAAVFLSFGVLSAFNRFAKRPNKAADSLSKHTFSIYFIHYVIVTVLLFALYDVNLPGVWKGIIVFAVALPVSWLLAALWSRFAHRN